MSDLEAAINSRIGGEGLDTAINNRVFSAVEAGELPELATSFNHIGISEQQAGRLMRAFQFERDEARRAEIVQEVVPGLTVQFDADNNAVLTFPNGQQTAINRPGFSVQDVNDAASLIPQMLIGALAARAGFAVGGTFGAVGGAAGSEAAMSIAEDAISQAEGSGREISLEKAAIQGGLAGLFEFAGPFVFKGLQRVFAKGSGGTTSGAAGTVHLTQQGRTALRQLGIDADSLTNNQLRQIERLVNQRGMSPEEFARRAKAASFDIPILRSQATGDPRLAARDSAARKGVFGEAARGTLAEFDQQQQRAIQGAVGDLQGRIGTGAAQEAGDGIERVQRALLQNKTALEIEITQAYTAARGRNAGLLKDGLLASTRAMRNALSERFNPLTAPKVFGTLKFLEDAQSQLPEGVTKVSLKSLENFRQQLTALGRSSDPVERAAARYAIEAFDTSLSRAVDDALIVGDTGALEAFTKARELRAVLTKRFGEDSSQNLVRGIIEIAGELEGERGFRQLVREEGAGAAQRATLTLTPTEAMNRLLGASLTNPRGGSVRAVERIRSILGPDSMEFKSLKEELFLRIFRPRPGQGFEGPTFSNRLEQLLRNAPELMRAVFTRQDLQNIARLTTTIQDVTTPPAGAVNFSNTDVVSRLLGDMNFLTRRTRQAIEFLGGNPDSLTASAIRQDVGTALSGPVTRPGTGAGAAVAVPVGEENAGQQ